MEIAFRTEALRKVCNDSKALRRKYGPGGQKLIRRRLDELRAAPTLETMRYLPAARCHELKGDLAGLLAVDIHKGYRIVFKPGNEPQPTKPDGGLDWAGVTAIVIEGIEDYHG